MRGKPEYTGTSLLARIIAFECGELEEGEEIALFQELIDTGTIYSLQGSYQRAAQALIEAGYCYHATDRVAD